MFSSIVSLKRKIKHNKIYINWFPLKIIRVFCGKYPFDIIVEELNIDFVILTNFSVYKKFCLKFSKMEIFINASDLPFDDFLSSWLIIFETGILKYLIRKDVYHNKFFLVSK